VRTYWLLLRYFLVSICLVIQRCNYMYSSYFFVQQWMTLEDLPLVIRIANSSGPSELLLLWFYFVCDKLIVNYVLWIYILGYQRNFFSLWKFWIPIPQILGPLLSHDIEAPQSWSRWARTPSHPVSSPCQKDWNTCFPSQWSLSETPELHATCVTMLYLVIIIICS